MKIILSVPTRNPDGFSEVEAEFLFDLAPHLASVATFAVHLEPITGLKYWNVTNVETGLTVINGQNHRAKAIRKAKEKMLTQTPSDVLSAYERAATAYPQLQLNGCDR